MPELQIDEKAIFNVARQISCSAARSEYLQQVTGNNGAAPGPSGRLAERIREAAESSGGTCIGHCGDA